MNLTIITPPLHGKMFVTLSPKGYLSISKRLSVEMNLARAKGMLFAADSVRNLYIKPSYDASRTDMFHIINPASSKSPAYICVKRLLPELDITNNDKSVRFYCTPAEDGFYKIEGLK